MRLLGELKIVHVANLTFHIEQSQLRVVVFESPGIQVRRRNFTNDIDIESAIILSSQAHHINQTHPVT